MSKPEAAGLAEWVWSGDCIMFMGPDQYDAKITVEGMFPDSRHRATYMHRLTEALNAALRTPSGARDGVEAVDDRELFEKWASMNVGQFNRAGYHGRDGVWFYSHNFQQQMWECWRSARKAACAPPVTASESAREEG